MYSVHTSSYRHRSKVELYQLERRTCYTKFFCTSLKKTIGFKKNLIIQVDYKYILLGQVVSENIVSQIENIDIRSVT